MADYENSVELAENPGEDISELQADLNLRVENWTVLNEENNEIQEEICEEIIVEQESENCFDISENYIEESIVYVIEEPALEFEFSNSQYIIQEEQESYDLNLTESTNAMISNNSQDEENTVQETSMVEDSVYNVKNSDSPVKTSNLSDTVDSAVEMISLPPEKPPTPTSFLPPVLKTQTIINLNENECSSSEKIVEDCSPKTDISSPGLKTYVLGKEQIKKRLQSFSLMKQGIQPIPIKKIISPKQPKVQVQIGEVYDETGRKTDEKVLVKKPPKQGPSPQEKARAVIDEIEQIKREEAAIYEQNLTFMTHSLRDAHKKKTKLKMRQKLHQSKKYKKHRSRSREQRRSPDVDKFEKKKREKSPEKEKIKDEEMPQNWTEIKQKDFDFEKIRKIKERVFKFSENPRYSPNRSDKKDRKKFQEDEKNSNHLKEEFCKPQLMFEYPSLLRHPIIALSIQGKTKYYPPEIVRYTEKHPSISFCENPQKTTKIYKTRSQILSEIPEDRAEIMMKIIENKLGNKSFCKYISGTWYEKEYLTESKLELESEPEPVISYGLSVLTEMYNDEQDENLDKTEMKNKDTSQEEEKIKTLTKIQKSKSRSRSKSKEKNQLKKTDIEIDKKKVDKRKTNDSSVQEKEDKLLSDDKTPNTDEYRSNWESDEDFLSEIIPNNDRSDYEKCYRRSNSPEKKWESDEEYNKYEDRKKRNNKDDRKRRKSSLEHEDRNKNRQDEDKRKRDRSSDRENKYSKEDKRHSKKNYEKYQDHESRRSSINLRKSSEKSSSKKSSTKHENEERSSSTQKSEERDFKKTREARHESKEKSSESNRNRKFSESSKHEEENKKYREEKSRSSYDSENRKSQDSERKKSKKECEEKKTEDYYFKSKNRDKKSKDRSESLEKTRRSSERNLKKYSTSKHETEESNRNSAKREKEYEKENKNREISKHETKGNDYHFVQSEKADRRLSKMALEEKNHSISNTEEKWQKSEEIERHSKYEIEEKCRLSSKIIKKIPEKEEKPKLNPKKLTDFEERSQHSSERDSKQSQEKKIEDKRRNFLQNVICNKWSSEEDIYKSVTSRNDRNKIEKLSKNIEEFSTIQLNLGPNYRKSQWSSDEDDKNQSTGNLENMNYLKKNKLVKRNYKTRWGSPEQNSEKYQNLEEMFEKHGNDLLNFTKDFHRSRKKAKNESSEAYSRKNKKKSKLEKKKSRSAEKEKHKKSKKKDKKDKKNKDKPKVQINYSDLEENLDDEFRSEKEKEVTIFNSNKYTPKIKIDYSDFDMSLMECKDKYEKKFDDVLEKSPEKTPQNVEILQSPYTPKVERKMNIDISEIFHEQNISLIKKTEVDKSSEIITETSTENDQKSTKSDPENPEIIPNISLPQTSKNEVQIYQEKLTMPVKILPEVTPVAPPVLPIPITDSITPIAPDPTDKLASEYEEFIKAVCFEEGPDKTTEDIEEPEVEDKDIEEDKSSAEGSSSEYETSESEESESVDSDIVTNIKTEKLTDSETESIKESKTEKRKRIESSSETEMDEKIVVKTEKEASKKLKISEEIKTFESESKYNNIIDWEKTCIENTDINLYQNYEPKTYSNLTYPIIDISEIVAPENIPLPCEEILKVQNIPVPNTDIGSPSEALPVSSESSSSTKPRSFIPIKLLTAESRKQANETAKSTIDEKEEKIASVDSSSDVNLPNLEVTATVEEAEQNSSSRKRQSQWQLNISPSKKPLLQASSIAEDSDEDFTDKFIKQSDKKSETSKKTTDLKSQEKSEQKDDKKPGSKSENDSRKSKEEPEPEKSHRKDEKSRLESRRKDRSPTPLKFNKDRHSRRPSREKIDRKPSPDRRRDRSRDRRETQRDRDKRRLSDRRQPDRKAGFSRGRSPRPRYSRERELRSRPSERSKDRGNKDKTRERDRSRDRGKRGYRRHSRSPSPNRKDYRRSLENVQVPHRLDDTDFSTTSMDIAHSPVNSPLDGFKRSLADSTISDSELITQLNTPDESNEPSPGYLQQYYPHLQEIPPENRRSPSSPKRISLDDRINLVLGIEKDPPKQIDTVCTRGPFTNNNPPNYDPYGYGRTDYDLYNPQQAEGYPVPQYSSHYQTPYYQNPVNTENNVKVVQVGNVIQVVPTEQPIVPAPPAQVVKPIEVPPKVVQVGNMLQIVPVTIIDSVPATSSPLTTAAPSNPSVMTVEKAITPKAIDQLVLERRAEKEKRRQEREQRRKEKEKKRKEKEKRRQLKIKTKTENMIKRALMLETGEGDLDISNVDAEPESETNDNNVLPMAWPPASVLTTVPLPKSPGKGILISFREKDESLCDNESSVTRKIVKFADGICPGEGTSPSAGEELPSPPPPPRKLPKEKRYKKVKNKNKKKIKVKIIRTLQPTIDEEESSEDNLPPPPPPPGSPPSHLWPPRVKQPPINNIHPSLSASVFPHPHPPTAYPTPQQVIYPPTFPSLPSTGQVMPVVMGHAPPPPPPQNSRQHHPPVLPVVPPGVPQSTPHHVTLHGQPSFHH